MRLDRNEKGRGKYAVINLRKLQTKIEGYDFPTAISAAVRTLEDAGMIEYGEPGTENEFFVLKLKDLGARAALRTYAEVYRGKGGDIDYARDIEELTERAGPKSPWCKVPD